MKPLTREEIDALERSGASMPYRFTGLWKGSYYYEGQTWEGPTNRLGNKERAA